MNKNALDTACRQLGALAEVHRLGLYRRLVEAAPSGSCVGELVDACQLSQPTVSFHLKELAQTGLVTRQKVGRKVYYAPDFSAMHGLMAYLMKNCCAGEQCLASLTACCEPTAAAA